MSRLIQAFPEEKIKDSFWQHMFRHGGQMVEKIDLGFNGERHDLLLDCDSNDECLNLNLIEAEVFSI